VQRIPVRLARRGNVYRGAFRPTVTGTWTIRVANFGQSYDRCSGARLSVRVGR
jgi:hypothetical protein